MTSKVQVFCINLKRHGYVENGLHDADEAGLITFYSDNNPNGLTVNVDWLVEVEETPDTDEPPHWLTRTTRNETNALSKSLASMLMATVVAKVAGYDKDLKVPDHHNYDFHVDGYTLSGDTVMAAQQYHYNQVISLKEGVTKSSLLVALDESDYKFRDITAHTKEFFWRCLSYTLGHTDMNSGLAFLDYVKESGGLAPILAKAKAQATTDVLNFISKGKI